MFYIRKLSKKSNIYRIKNAANNAVMDADILKQELGTSGNTLSFWKCDSQEAMKDAMKAILLSTTSIETTQFVILDDDLLARYHIDIDDTEVGMTGYKGFENLHVNLCNLTYEKIGYILTLMKEVVEQPGRTPELKKEEVKRYIFEVKNAGLLNKDNIREELWSDINKYCNLTA